MKLIINLFDKTQQIYDVINENITATHSGCLFRLKNGDQLMIHPQAVQMMILTTEHNFNALLRKNEELERERLTKQQGKEPDNQESTLIT